MQEVEHWDTIENHSAIRRRWTFADFAEALSFVNTVSMLAESANHHPDIQFGWGYVELYLTTHDAGKQVTEKDISLAEQINQL